MGPGGEALTHGVHILEDCRAHNAKCEWKWTGHMGLQHNVKAT